MMLPNNIGGDTSSKSAGHRWQMSHWRQLIRNCLGGEVVLQHVVATGETYVERVKIGNFVGRNKVKLGDSRVVNIANIKDIRQVNGERPSEG